MKLRHITLGTALALSFATHAHATTLCEEDGHKTWQIIGRYSYADDGKTILVLKVRPWGVNTDKVYFFFDDSENRGGADFKEIKAQTMLDMAAGNKVSFFYNKSLVTDTGTCSGYTVSYGDANGWQPKLPASGFFGIHSGND